MKDLKRVLKTVMDRKRSFVTSLLFAAFLSLRSHRLSGGCGGPWCPGPEGVCAKWFCRIQCEGCPTLLLH